MNKKQKLLTVIMAAILLLFIGSSCVQDLITPAYVDKDAAAWAEVPTKLWSKQPYTTLWDVKRLLAAMDFKFAKEQIKHGYYSGIMNVSKFAGTELKQTIFSPTGPVAALAAGIPGLALGAYLIPRPKDKKKITELEVKNGNNAGTN